MHQSIEAGLIEEKGVFFAPYSAVRTLNPVNSQHKFMDLHNA